MKMKKFFLVLLSAGLVAGCLQSGSSVDSEGAIAPQLKSADVSADPDVELIIQEFRNAGACTGFLNLTRETLTDQQPQPILHEYQSCIGARLDLQTYLSLANSHWSLIYPDEGRLAGIRSHQGAEAAIEDCMCSTGGRLWRALDKVVAQRARVQNSGYGPHSSSEISAPGNLYNGQSAAPGNLHDAASSSPGATYTAPSEMSFDNYPSPGNLYHP